MNSDNSIFHSCWDKVLSVVAKSAKPKISVFGDAQFVRDVISQTPGVTFDVTILVDDEDGSDIHLPSITWSN